MRQSLQEKFVKLDQFGITPTLYAKGRKKYQSITGAIFSILIKVFLLVELILQMKIMVLYKDDHIRVTTETVHDKILDLKQVNYLPFYIFTKKDNEMKIEEWQQLKKHLNIFWG